MINKVIYCSRINQRLTLKIISGYLCNIITKSTKRRKIIREKQITVTDSRRNDTFKTALSAF